MKSGKLGTVIADGLDGAAFFGFLAAAFFFWGFGLLKDERVTAIFIAFEIIGGRLAAQVTINTLVVHVILSRDVLWIFICSVCHKNCLSI